MENKIQQLTEKLYAEGLQRGKAESERMITKAKTEAERIIHEAKENAEKILAEARRHEQELAVNTRKELALAGTQMIADVKQSVRETLLKSGISGDVKSSFNNPSFISSLIEQLIISWGKGGTIEVPASYEKEINDYLLAKLSEDLRKGLVIRPSVNVKEGFRVEMENGHYYINFGKEEFDLFLADYLRPKVAKIIFNKEE